MSNYIQYVARRTDNVNVAIVGQICVDKPINSTECIFPVLYYRSGNSICLDIKLDSPQRLVEKSNYYTDEHELTYFSTFSLNSLFSMSIWAGFNHQIPNMTGGHLFLRAAQTFENEDCYRYFFCSAIQDPSRILVEDKDVFYQGDMNNELIVTEQQNIDLSILKGNNLGQAVTLPIWGIKDKFRFKNQLRLDVYEQVLDIHEQSALGNTLNTDKYHPDIIGLTRHAMDDFGFKDWMKNLYEEGYKPTEEYYLQTESYIKKKEKMSKLILEGIR